MVWRGGDRERTVADPKEVGELLPPFPFDIEKIKEKSYETNENERKMIRKVNKKRKNNIFLVSKYTYITLKRIEEGGEIERELWRIQRRWGKVTTPPLDPLYIKRTK